MAKFNKKWIERGSDSDQRIIIDKKSKTQILQQLESFGFNQATLFPEVDILFIRWTNISFLQKLQALQCSAMNKSPEAILKHFV